MESVQHARLAATSTPTVTFAFTVEPVQPLIKLPANVYLYPLPSVWKVQFFHTLLKSVSAHQRNLTAIQLTVSHVSYLSFGAQLL